MGKTTLTAKSLTGILGSLGLLIAFAITGCTGSPKSVYGGYTNGNANSNANMGTNNANSNSNSNQGSNNGAPWDPFNPDGGSGEVVTFYSGGATLVAWGQQRCASYGDSLNAWNPQLPIADTSEGRFRWAEHHALSGPGGENYGYYYQIARQATNASGNPMQLYPSFAVNNNGALSLPSGKAPANYPHSVTALYPGYVLVAFCVPSCYRGNQKLYFANEIGRPIRDLKRDTMSVPIAAAKSMADAGHGFLAAVSLSPASIFGALELITTKIHHFTRDIDPGRTPDLQRFYFIRTPGGVAQLTANHGLIMDDGHARTAEDVANRFFAGHREGLMTASSSPVPILDVQAYDLPELSYNITLEGDAGAGMPTMAEHIVPFGNDEVLALDNMGQQMLSQSADDLNRQLDREGLTESLFMP